MADLDRQAAMDLSRSINADPRRKSIAPIRKRELPPRAAKRARTNKDAALITAQSMPLTPPHTTSLGPESSPLSSPPSSGESFSFDEQSTANQSSNPFSEPSLNFGNRSTSHQPYYNFSELSLNSNEPSSNNQPPYLFSESSQAINQVKNKEVYDPFSKQSLKFSEQLTNKESHDPFSNRSLNFSEQLLINQPRSYPLSKFPLNSSDETIYNQPHPSKQLPNSNEQLIIDQSHTTELRSRSPRIILQAGNNINMGRIGTIDGVGAIADRARAVEDVTSSMGSKALAIEGRSDYPLTYNYISHNSSGVWSSGSHDVTKGDYAAVKSVRRRRSTVTHQPGYFVTTDAVESEPKQSKLRKPPVKKRKAEDDDFSGDHDANDDSDAFISPEKPAKRSRGAGQRKAGKPRVPVAAYHANTQLGKPEPHGQPEVWADKRQQLCETLRYFNAYQSGAYTNDGIAYGHLIDAEVDPRDKFDEQIVITSVGGGRSKDENNKTIRTKDQVKSTTAAAFMRTKELKIPVAVIAGQGNRISPSRLPHYYNILGWFHVTDVWAEKCGGIITWRVRLEKICLTEKSWWAVKDSPALIQDDRQNVESTKCLECDQCSKTIFNAGWACLNTACSSYFQFADFYDDATLDYSNDFLRERTVFEGSDPGSLAPPLLTAQDMTRMDAFGVELAFKRGIVCPKCGCCSRRIAWDHWFCENSNCDFTYSLEQRPMSISDVLARALDMEDDGNSSKEAKPDTFVAPDIRSSQTIYGPWDVNQYEILGEAGEVVGFVRHFKSNCIINQQKDGPNDLFMQVQAGKFNLRRNPARQGGSTGEILTSHWAANWGAPYKYGVKQVSKGFDEAPAVILKAIKRLTWAGQHAVTGEFEPFQPFNECLSIGYFENTKIGYHDDGEKELGPTVATLSLGAKAVMSFRPKARSTIGGKIGKGSKKEKPAVLSITLEHGDIIVMHGRKIQQFYEHAVTPKGPLRYALTCRYVRPELTSDAQDAALKGALPPASEQYNYDGDVNAAPIVHAVSEVDKFINNIAARLKTGDLTVSDVLEITKRLATIAIPPNVEPERAIESKMNIAVVGVA